jgi:phytoene dehydrogenase-like protein
MQNVDVAIIGAGHNGLTCAAYLAAGGLSVAMFEAQPVVGGAAVTEEFHPGFRNSVASYTVSLLNPKVIADLELARHGLRIVERRVNNFLPAEDGSYLLAGSGITAHEIARFSTGDAEKYRAFSAEIDAIAEILRQLVLETPPNLAAAGFGSLVAEFGRSARVGNRLRKLDVAERRALVELFTRSAGEYLDSWFSTDLVKALFGFDAVVGTFASPYTPGTAYVLLHHAFGEVNGRKGVWGHAIGGMGAITQAMAACCRERGVAIETGAAVREVIVEQGRARGVSLADGRTIRAGAVVANVNPRLLFERLVPDGAAPADFMRRIRNYACGSGTFRMNVALSELPQFTALPGRGLADHHTSGIILAPSLAYMDRAYRDALDTGWSTQPIVEMLIPSTLDASLAPQGAHVASLFCQHANPRLPGGASWDAHRETMADIVIDTVERFAPGFRASIIGRQILSPLDLERRFGLTGGDIFHGRLSLDQIFSTRPILGHADYRMPIAGLYLCGSGAHPGGGVSGAPGHNAAREMLRDRRAIRRHA